MFRCLNCDAEVAEKHCPVCGQRADVRPITFRNLVSGAIEHVLDLEKPLVRTTLECLWKPGVVAARYCDGRRQRYSNPLKFLVIWAAVMLLLFSWVMDRIEALQRWTAAGAPDPQTAASNEETMRIILDNADLLTLLALPVVALASRLVFLVDRRRAAEHLVLACYAYGVTYFVQFVTTPVLLIDSLLVLAIHQSLSFVYHVVALAQFCRTPGPWWTRTLMAVGVQFLLVAVILVASIVGGVVFALLF